MTGYPRTAVYVAAVSTVTLALVAWERISAWAAR